MGYFRIVGEGEREGEKAPPLRRHQSLPNEQKRAADMLREWRVSRSGGNLTVIVVLYAAEEQHVVEGGRGQDVNHALHLPQVLLYSAESDRVSHGGLWAVVFQEEQAVGVLIHVFLVPEGDLSLLHRLQGGDFDGHAGRWGPDGAIMATIVMVSEMVSAHSMMSTILVSIIMSTSTEDDRGILTVALTGC